MAAERDEQIGNSAREAASGNDDWPTSGAAWNTNFATGAETVDSRALGEAAVRQLAAGQWSAARDLLRRIVQDDPANTGGWLNLAAALRGLGQNDEAMQALDQALAIEPRNARALLEAASAYQGRGNSRTAAAVYRTALESIPANVQPTPELRHILQAARNAIDSNNLDLENFLESRLAPLRTRHGAEPLGRFDRAMATLLLKRRVYRPQPSFLYFPYLPAIEFYERGDFPWLDPIEAATDDIRGELIDVIANCPDRVRPYMAVAGAEKGVWRELNNTRRWGAFFFWREGVRFSENLALCPRTAAALEAWPACDIPGCAPTAMFSILEPRTRIPPHVGVNNCRLVVHVPLVIPPGCGFRVGAETRPWEPGKALIFDDTIEHEAWNNSDDWRAVLILDIWNPNITAAEREMIRALTKGVEEFYGDLPPYIKPVQTNN